MRVLFATGIYPPDIGGPATYVSGLADELSRRGLGVEVVTYGDVATVESAVPVHVVTRAGLLPLRYARYAASVCRAARRSDIVYLQDPISSGFPGSWGASLAGRPYLLKVVGDAAWEIAWESGLMEDDFPSYQRKRYSLRVEVLRYAQATVARRARRVIVPSAFLGNVVRGWGVRPERIEVVPNAIRHAETPGISRDDAKARLGLSGRLVILSASRLVPWKGFDKLIRLAAGMKGDLPEVRWVIAGTGPCEASLRKLSREVGSEEAVVFAGRLDRDAMSLHLAACDLFVLWSGYEGLSHVLLEAMGAGRAVIASDAGGNPEVLEGGRGGVLVPLGDEAGLARTLRALCRDSVARERLEREARAIVTARFAWPSMVRRTLEVLESAAGGA